MTQSATLDTTAGAAAQSLYLGKRNKPFAFQDLKMKVELCECSARVNSESKEADVAQVRAWLWKLR